MGTLKLRPEQERIVKAILDRFLDPREQSCIVLLRAPTGFGKTVIALSVAYILSREYGLRTTVFVRTRSQLQRYVEDCLKFFRRLPRLRLNRFITCPTPIRPCTHCTYVKRVEEEIIQTLVEKYRYDPYSRELICQLYRSRICPYESWKNIESFITVCTYPHIVNPKLREEIIPRTDIAIVDEAHNLENVVSTSMKIRDIVSLVDAFMRIGEVEGDLDIVSTCRDILTAILKIREKCTIQQTARIDIDEIVNIVNKLDETFRRCLDYVDTRKREYVKLLEKYAEVRGVLEHVATCRLLYASYRDDSDSIEFKTTELSNVGKIIAPFRRIVLMSGTLPGRYYIEHVWNIRQEKIVTINVEDRRKMLNIYIVTGVSTRYVERGDETYRKYARIISTVFKQARKSILTFYPSREVMNSILRHVEHRVVTGSRTMQEIIDAASRGKTIIADVFGGRLSEGVELMRSGEQLISDIVIVGVPYPRYDTFMKMLIEKLKSRGVNARYYMIEKAWQQIRQAVGRACRGSDIVNIWMVDDRYVEHVWIQKIATLPYREIREVNYVDMLEKVKL